jgi:deazaflavin-dependent oxidoreductase (nitroreductase family)
MNPLQRVARNPTAYRWLVLPARPVAVRVEAVLRFATGGRVGVLDLAGLPCVQITTKGRKTGLARTATVQCVPVDDRLVLVGSNWGRPHHPSWSANLLAAQRVNVRGHGDFFTAKSRLLTGEERETTWATILASWPNYQIAQDRTGGRQFRLFLLTHSSHTGD